jgi:hypothetical protein
VRITSCGQAGRSQGREGDCRARRLTITRTMAVGMDAPALDGWTPTRIPGRGPPPRADTLADGRRGRPHRRTGSFVIRAPRPTRRDGRLQTTRGRASGHGVGRGGRPSWCPLAPSSRPSKVSILDGGPGGCPSGCPAVQGGSVHPDRLSCLEGAGEQYERALAIGEAALGPDHPTVPAIRGNLEVVLQALTDAPSEGLPRTSRDISALWPTTASCSSTSCPSSPGPRVRRSVNRSRRVRSRSHGP